MMRMTMTLRNEDDNDDENNVIMMMMMKKQVLPSHIKLIIDAFNVLCKTLLLLPPAIYNAIT